MSGGHDLVPTKVWFTSKSGPDLTVADGYLYRRVSVCSRCGLKSIGGPRLSRPAVMAIHPGDVPLAGFIAAREDASATTCDEMLVQGILES